MLSYGLDFLENTKKSQLETKKIWRLKGDKKKYVAYATSAPERDRHWSMKINHTFLAVATSFHLDGFS